jgi:hypothetical protein
MKRALFLSIALMLAPAQAAEHLVRGLSLGVNDPLPGDTASPRHLSIKVRDRVSGLFAGDPLENGCTLRIVANGATSTSQTIAIPPGAFQDPEGPGWTGFVKKRKAIFRYVDERGQNGPVTSLSIKQVSSRVLLSITLDTRGKNGTIEVVPPNPGTDGGALLSINGGDSYCVGFGGAAGGKIRENTATEFRVSKPRGRACPIELGSAGGAFLD